MKHFILISLLLLAFPLCASSADNNTLSAYERVMKTGTIRCGAVMWPPFFEVEPNTGDIQGLGADFYREMASLIDINIEFVDVVLGQQVEDLNRNRIDVMCNEGPWAFSSIKFMEYSHPAYFSPVYLYTKEGRTDFTRMDQLNIPNITFVSIDGDLSQTLAQRRFPNAKLLSLPAITDVAALMLYITTGKADAAIIDPAAVDGFNKNNETKLIKILDKEPFAIYPVGVAVRKGEQELLNVLNAAISAVWNTGSGETILRKYDPTGETLLAPAKPYIGSQ